MAEREKTIPFASETEHAPESPAKEGLSSSLDEIEKGVVVLREADISFDYKKRDAQNNRMNALMGEHLERIRRLEDHEMRSGALCDFISSISNAEFITPDEVKNPNAGAVDNYFDRVIEAIELLGDTKTPESLVFLQGYYERLSKQFAEKQMDGPDFVSIKWRYDNWLEVDPFVFDKLFSQIISKIGDYNNEVSKKWIDEQFSKPTNSFDLVYFPPRMKTEFFEQDEGGVLGGERYFMEIENEVEIDGIFTRSQASLFDAVLETRAPHEAADIITEWVQKDRLAYVFREDVAKALNRTDAEYAKNKLLETISAPPNPHVRELAINILYRLELGEIEITDEGFDYLNKKYNLGEYNKKGNVARRLTAEGKVGVFDSARTLAVYFEAARPDTAEKNLTPELKKVSVSDLFFPRPNETADEREARVRGLETFSREYFQVYQSEIFKATGIYLSDLSLREQGAFLLFREAIGNDKERSDNLMHFLRVRGESAFRALLALQYSPELFDALYKISLDTLPGYGRDRQGERFFKKVSEITEAAKQVENYLCDTYGQDESSAFRIAVITERLMQRAVGLIKDWGKDPQAVGAEEIRALDEVKANVLLFAAAFKEVSKDRAIDLTEVAETSMETVEATSISMDERAKMKEIFVGNRKQYPEELLEKTVKEFERSLEGKSKFYILRHNDDIVGYLRFEKRTNDVSYAGSFNVSPEVRGFAIGSSLLRQAIEREGQTRAIEAVVYEKNSMLKHYTGEFGFKIIAEIPDYEGTGEKFYKIERPPTHTMERSVLREAA